MHLQLPTLYILKKVVLYNFPFIVNMHCRNCYLGTHIIYGCHIASYIILCLSQFSIHAEVDTLDEKLLTCNIIRLTIINLLVLCPYSFICLIQGFLWKSEFGISWTGKRILKTGNINLLVVHIQSNMVRQYILGPMQLVLVSQISPPN